MVKNQGLIWMGGLFGLGMLAVASSPKGRRAVEQAVENVEETVEEGVDWIKRIVDRTSKHEGTYDSMNLNTDNAGLSFGRLQWSQRTGALGKLLAEMHLGDPERFQNIFGQHWRRLLDATKVGSLGPVGGAVLWSEPWISRFKTAAREPSFMELQDRLASGGEYMTAAIAAAKLLGVTTERAISITYDTSVQQGPGAAKNIAQDVRKQFQGQTIAARQLLERYIQQAAAPFRTTVQPGQHKRHPRLEWRPVGREWHVFAGKVDLFTNITNRRTGLLTARDLSDSNIII